MTNKVIHKSEARKAILAGAEILYNAVKETYGPNSGNVAIMKGYGSPTITHDGVTVAKSIDLKGDEAVGVEIIRSTAGQMDKVLGDGTTTVTILAYHILKEASELSMFGKNPMILRAELNADMDKVLAKLPELSEEITSEESLAFVAGISASDPELGAQVASVVYAVGKDGSVTVEAGDGLETTTEIVEGFTLDSGLLSGYFVTNPERMEAVLDKPKVAVLNESLQSQEQLAEIFEGIGDSKSILIIADDISGDALSALVRLNLGGTLSVAAVKSPSFGDKRLEQLKDIASVVDGVAKHEGSKLSLGTADKVVVGADSTVIVREKRPKTHTERLRELAGAIKQAEPGYKKDGLMERRSQLEGKVAVIKVGGATETEIEEKKFRVDDAVAAAKAALEAGIVPGGAVTLLDLAPELGAESLLGKALKQPFHILLENVGLNSKDFEAGGGKGVDVSAPDGLVDMKKSGIIEPTKTVREAIKTAVSIAGTAITVKAIVAPVEEKKNESL